MTNLLDRTKSGYILENKNLFVCGFEGYTHVLFQLETSKPRRAKLYTNNKGIYFTFEGKRQYVQTNEVTPKPKKESKDAAPSTTIIEASYTLEGEVIEVIDMNFTKTNVRKVAKKYGKIETIELVNDSILITYSDGFEMVFTKKDKEVVNTPENKNDNELSNMIGDAGYLIAGLQSTNTNTLKSINPEKYKAHTPFANWLQSTVETTIKKAVWEDHEQAINLMMNNPDLIPVLREEVEKTFITTFGAENLTCKHVDVNKVFGTSIVSKYSYLAKQNGFNPNDVDRLIQSTIYRVLKENNRLEMSA